MIFVLRVVVNLVLVRHVGVLRLLREESSSLGSLLDKLGLSTDVRGEVYVKIWSEVAKHVCQVCKLGQILDPFCVDLGTAHRQWLSIQIKAKACLWLLLVIHMLGRLLLLLLIILVLLLFWRKWMSQIILTITYTAGAACLSFFAGP